MEERIDEINVNVTQKVKVVVARGTKGLERKINNQIIKRSKEEFELTKIKNIPAEDYFVTILIFEKI